MRDREGANEGLDALRAPTALPPDPIMKNDMEKLSLNENSAVYTGSSHWMAILENVYPPVIKFLLGGVLLIML